MNSFGQFFQDDSTKRFSAIRLVFLAWALGTLTTWGYLSVKKGDIQSLPQPVEVILLTLMTGKVVQKFGEKSAATEPNKPLSTEAESLNVGPDTEEEVAQSGEPTAAAAPSSNGQTAGSGNRPTTNMPENAELSAC